MTLDLDRDLALRLRIESLFADYVHCIDDHRLEEWPDFFTDDGRYQVITRENHELGLPVGLIYCNGKGMLRDRISALRRANIFEPHVYRHMFSAVKPIATNDGEIEVTSNFTVTRTMENGSMSVFACGRYADRIVEENEGFKFVERVVILDSRSVDTLLVIPI